jgi:hypothetical protein
MTRGRWKRVSRITVDRYICVDQLHIDAKDEPVLCVCGPIKFMLLDESAVTVLWLKEHVVPGLTAFYDRYNTISDVLVLPLLWTCLDAGIKKKFPTNSCNRICYQYRQIRVLEPNVNPVKRLQLSVYRVQEQLCIYNATSSNNDGNNNNNNNQTLQQPDAQINSLMIQLQQTRQLFELGLVMLNHAV